MSRSRERRALAKPVLAVAAVSCLAASPPAVASDEPGRPITGQADRTSGVQTDVRGSSAPIAGGRRGIVARRHEVLGGGAAPVAGEMRLTAGRSHGAVLVVRFDFGSVALRPLERRRIDRMAAAVRPAERVVVGHTDSVGSRGFNLRLSRARAFAVATYLRARGVVVRARWHGESRPVARNQHPDGTDDPVGRQLNRRVVIRLPGSGKRGAADRPQRVG